MLEEVKYCFRLGVWKVVIWVYLWERSVAGVF